MGLVALIPFYLVVWLLGYISAQGTNFRFVKTYFRNGWIGQGEGPGLLNIYAVLTTFVFSPFLVWLAWKIGRRR
jgi:hypothetical protein